MEGKKITWNMKGRMIFLSSISRLTLVLERAGKGIRDFLAFSPTTTLKLFHLCSKLPTQHPVFNITEYLDGVGCIR